MSVPFTGEELASAITAFAPDAITTVGAKEVWIRADRLTIVAQGLKERAGLDFAMLNSITGVDYIGHFEVVYHLTSLAHNRSAVLKVRCGEGRAEPSVPSVYVVWRGADYQEREVWDLMGIRFTGHPNHKRIMLWEDFPGHPLRKDFLR